ncbi:MAG TPA: bifunctional molybdenum cofactor biosynthesis protein MoaC/MoaB [Bacteroidia bacterium]|nr:bifunctional molybdenum cofactor biosynthesis protein MoaC/MoaB [Bacteroidia bacterium]HNT79931.1 bifunctional molybdenum cofactor biosynthesis protein MoaC/MoaB [Bacteroidia bacterium]
MIDITHKTFTLRTAIATAIVRFGSSKTAKMIKELKVPKGNVCEAAKVAALFAVKKTSELIPDCHPMPIEGTQVSFVIKPKELLIEVEVKTIYKTGVEVEAMHAASVAALTVYDMLKPVDKQISIHEIKLKEKKGGKSDYSYNLDENFHCGIIVCSDSVAKGKKVDSAGLAIKAELKKYGVNNIKYQIIPDDEQLIKEMFTKYKSKNYSLIIFCGGTGLSPRDHTPDIVKPLIEKEIPGVMEAARSYGQQRTPYAMLSRGIAGFAGKSLVLTLPGSTRGAIESMKAVFPYLLHLFHVRDGGSH